MGEYYDKTKYPEKPAYFKNLEKARQVRHEMLQEKRAKETEDFLRAVGTARDMLNEPELWFDHCEKTGKRKKPGRPPLPPEKLKHKPMSRNQEVRLMLKNKHGITINDDNNIILKNGNMLFGFKFLKNGRVRDSEGITMSAHQMLQLI